ncbi:MAG: 30S ribosomal protein S4 [Planctomycetes bacterium]|jgi:small subunit ribosomal protein S4|nr:30S ribosomal protein S4 [Planctomycetota bacterium]
MARNTTAKCAQCRRSGEKLFLRGDRCFSAKCAMVKRNYAPGQHGPEGKKKTSDYGLQLAEKQKAKKYYGLLEKQFRITFERAKNKTGNTGENFVRMLETRLDNVVFRAGFASSRSQARQLVNHYHFNVNEQKVNIPSFQVKPGDVISIRKSSKNNSYFRNWVEGLQKNTNDRVSWISFNKEEISAKVLHEPKPEDLPANINAQVIVEFYSK